MTNYEKYKDEIVDMLVRSTTFCYKIRKIRTGSENTVCPVFAMTDSYEPCRKCEKLNKQWLNDEAEYFDPAELKAGDKIRMRKHGNTEFSEFEVVCNCFPACWLRFRESENGIPKADDDFLIFYDDLLDKYEIKEVFR